jgi:hypothetical protein
LDRKKELAIFVVGLMKDEDQSLRSFGSYLAPCLSYIATLALERSDIFALSKTPEARCSLADYPPNGLFINGEFGPSYPGNYQVNNIR